jgi:prepilin-type N-terminal cleavage/methylation domain-containing protein
MSTGSRRGFTLLELLLAMTAFALIAVIVGGAMRLGYSSREKGEKKIEATERLRRTVDVLSAQIESFLPLPDDGNEGTAGFFQGDRKSLSLPTSYSLWQGQRGYVVATYSVASGGAGEESLFVSEKIVGMETENKTLLLTGTRIEFAYLEKGLTTRDDRWVDQWADPDTIPEKIRVHLICDGQDYYLTVAPKARRST